MTASAPTTAPFCHKETAIPARLPLLLLALLVLVLSSACVRQREAPDPGIRILRAGSLAPMEHEDVAEAMYMDVRDLTGRNLVLPAHVERYLESTGVRLVEKPSQAGYILHISLLCEGTVSPEVLSALVESGYGTDARFSGDGGHGLLADILLVARTVPSHARPSRARLKNISSRNALGASQMRLALFAPFEPPPHSALPESFVDALSRELDQALKQQP